MKNLLLILLVSATLICVFSLPISPDGPSSPYTFSVYVNKEGTEAQFLSKMDEKYRIPNTIVHNLEADSNWYSKFNKAITVGGCKSIPVDADITFDFNADAIGFPIDVFRAIIQSLSESSNLHCSDELEKPTCKYEGNIEALPTIFFEDSLAIPYWVYVDDKYNESTGMITLNLKGIPAASSQGESRDFIILGRQVMSYYYTVFQRNSGRNVITLYTANHNSNAWLYIFLGCIGLVLILGVGIWGYVHKYRMIDMNYGSSSYDEVPFVVYRE